jgi:predicted GIY-YIG superfamily endonuclease
MNSYLIRCTDGSAYCITATNSSEALWKFQQTHYGVTVSEVVYKG